MHIETIHIERSGSLHGVTIDRLGPGVQVLHGTNETGKTSLLEFVRAMFFGFEGLFRRGVLDPQLPCAGRLVVHTGPDGRRLAIERWHEGPELATLTRASYEDDIVGLGGDHGDFISITDIVPPTDGRPWNRPYLQDIVGDIDERTFTNVMAFGLDELHELRTLEPEGCGSRLYELASGLDRSKVTRVLTHIRQAIDRLDSTDPAVSPIESLRLRRHEVLDRLAALHAPAVAAGGLLAELARTDAEIASLEAAIERAVADEDVVRGVLWLEPLHRAHRQAAAQLDALMGTSLVHADLDGWKRAAKLRNKLARLVRRRKRTRSRLARSLAEVPAESAIWQKRAAVTALCEEQPRLERMVAEVARAESHARLAARRFGEQVGAAGLARIVSISGPLDATDGLPDVLLPEGFTHSFGPLRARARDCAKASQDVKEAKRGVAEAKGLLEDTRGLVKGGVGPKGMTIAEAIEEASGRATLFRNRLAATAQLAELDRSLARLDDEVARHLEGQLIPIGWLIALGAMFVTGAGMLLSGLLLPETVTGPLAYALAALGLAGTGLASVTTWSLDRAASNRLEAARGQHEMVHKQRDELLAQCGLLDKKIPVDTVNSLERRAALAQAEVERLEELAAREGSMNVLSDKVAVAQQSLRRALAVRKAARLRWQKALEHRGLPTTLSPREVKQIGLHRHTLLTLDDDRRRLSEEARHKREELAAFARRIDELMVVCDLVPEATPLEHLGQLREKLAAESLAH
ncbi:MAG: AAA family ATPase, partial [Planctomycetia bacterium]